MSRKNSLKWSSIFLIVLTLFVVGGLLGFGPVIVKIDKSGPAALDFELDSTCLESCCKDPKIIMAVDGYPQEISNEELSLTMKIEPFEDLPVDVSAYCSDGSQVHYSWLVPGRNRQKGARYAFKATCRTCGLH